MLTTIKNLLGFGPKVDYKALLNQGAIILDVRTAGEYKGGHIKGSTNIALDALSSSLGRLKDKNKPVITCCASGMRSGAARRLLLSKGYKEVYNGGSWLSLLNKL